MPRNKLALLAFASTLSTLSTPVSIRAQNPPETRKNPPPNAYASEPFIYERLETRMRFESDGTGWRDVRARLRVQTPAGLERAGQLVFEYNAENESVDIRSVRVTKPDGSVLTAGPDSVQDLSSPVTREAPMYTDARQKHVTVPGLAVGSIVEYDVVTTEFKPLLANQFWQTWNFASDAICLEEQVELNVPRDRALKIKSPSGVDPTILDEGNRRMYHWTTSTLQYPALPNQMAPWKFDPAAWLRANQPPPPRRILISTFQSWSEIGRWYAGLERDRRAVTPEIRAKAAEIIAGQTTDIARTQALYEWVSRNIRYVSLSFGIGRYQPHNAGEVLSNRYGDCKDKATLLESLLEAAGLSAQAVLINSGADIDPDVPTPHQFDHAITFVRVAGEDHWLDSTLSVGPFDYLLPQLRGKQALVVFTSSDPELKSTPASLRIPKLYRLDVKGRRNADKTWNASLHFTTRGDLEVFIRATLLRVPPAQFSSIIQRSLAEADKSDPDRPVSFDDFKAGDPTDTQNPFQVDLEIHGKASQGGAKKPPPFDLATILSVLPAVDASSGASLKSDHAAVKLGGPEEFALNIELEMPPSPEAPPFKPAHVSVSKSFAEFEYSAACDGQLSRTSLRLNLRVPEVPKSDESDYSAFRQQVMDTLDQTPFLTGLKRKDSGPAPAKNGSSSRPTHVPLPEAVALYDKGQAEINRRNWANAEAALLDAVKLDPEYAQAWANLGRARMYLRKLPEAEANFRKCLELAPGYAYCYAELSWSLTAQRKYDDAAALLESRIADAPNDADAHHRLAGVYLNLQQPARAVTELQKTVTLEPKNASAHFDLGRAYLEVHENDKAAASLEHAVSLNDGDLYLNNAAYLLSEHKTHLETAESWSLKSIEKVELELNQATVSRIAPRITQLVSSLAMYWDTLAWIKFQNSDFPAAEKIQRAAWALSDDPVMGLHMGRIYEAEHRMNDAMDAYAMALAAIHDPATQFKDLQIEARSRLAAFLESEALADQRIDQARSQLKQRRSVTIPNQPGVEGIAQYLLIVGPDSEVLEMEAVNADESVAALRDSVRAATLPLYFADTTLQKLPATGVLSCPRSDHPCTFTLLSSSVSSRMLLPSTAESTTP